MKTQNLTQRHKKLVVAALIHRLEFWQDKMNAAKMHDDDELWQKALGYVTEYADLLAMVGETFEHARPQRSHAPRNARTVPS